MIQLRFDCSNAAAFVQPASLQAMQDEVTNAHAQLIGKLGKGNDFLGWINLPAEIDETLFKNIEEDAKYICENAQILVVIGIGGSYLGAKAVIEALSSPFAALEERKNPLVVFAGNSLSQDYHAQLLKLLDNKDYAVVVVSKSGTTTEPAIAFRLFKKHLEEKYATSASRRIFAVTDARKGALKILSDKEGYKTYVIPDDVGGRYSVFTPVGLLPIAVAGFDIRKLMEGAKEMAEVCLASDNLSENPAARYAAVRTSLYRAGKNVELLVNYEPSLHYITEWWKQLFGESDGKDGEGLFPAGVDFTSDLHSMGQYIQEGQRLMFETVLHIAQTKEALKIPTDSTDMDGLNFIAGKSMHEVNQMAALGTTLAHMDGEVPNLDIYINRIDERSLGELLYFFEFACAMGGYMLGINPFNQPGVEAYKNNMFALLGKPGYETQTAQIRERLKQE